MAIADIRQDHLDQAIAHFGERGVDVMPVLEEDALYILPYPEFHDMLENIHGNVMAALARPEDDPEYEKRAARGVPGGKE